MTTKIVSAWGQVPPLALGPPRDSVGFRAYALGLIPVDGQFTRFHGRLVRISPDDPGCRLDLTVEAASLLLASPERTRQVTGPEFLDAGKFPELSYAGQCSGDKLVGVLTMHGIARPLEMAITRDSNGLRIQAEAVRAAWGITAEPFTIGPRLRLTLNFVVSP